METLREKIRIYFQTPAEITNGWIDTYRGWPILNLFLVFISLTCLLLNLFGFDLNPYLCRPLYAICLGSVIAEIFHFLAISYFFSKQ